LITLPEETEEVGEDLNIERPNLILCEGLADKSFLERLLEFHRLATVYQVITPIETGGGIDKFNKRLAVLPLNRRFSTLSSLVLISDNDTAHSNPFHRLKQEIRKANEIEPLADYPIPEEPHVPITKEGYPALVAVFLPWHDRRGNLEVLLLDAFSEEWPDVKRAAESLINTTTEGWNDDEKAQAVLQMMIAMTCRNEAACSLRYIWSKQPFRRLIESRSFFQLAEFLRDLPSSL
jgi:hypothetical protein